MRARLGKGREGRRGARPPRGPRRPRGRRRRARGRGGLRRPAKGRSRQGTGQRGAGRFFVRANAFLFVARPRAALERPAALSRAARRAPRAARAQTREHKLETSRCFGVGEPRPARALGGGRWGGGSPNPPARAPVLVSTGGGTRRVRLVRDEGRGVSSQYGREGGGWRAEAPPPRSPGVAVACFQTVCARGAAQRAAQLRRRREGRGPRARWSGPQLQVPDSRERLHLLVGQADVPPRGGEERQHAHPQLLRVTVCLRRLERLVPKRAVVLCMMAVVLSRERLFRRRRRFALLPQLRRQRRPLRRLGSRAGRRLEKVASSAHHPPRRGSRSRDLGRSGWRAFASHRGLPPEYGLQHISSRRAFCPVCRKIRRDRSRKPCSLS